MYGMIYCIQNKLNGKVYIGQTTMQLCRRKAVHLNDAKKGCEFYLHRAIRKYGKDAFIWRILGYAACQFGLDILEKSWMWITSDYNYNIREGGSHGKASKESREKMSKARKGKKLTEEHIRNRAESYRGYKQTIQHRINASKVRRKFSHEEVIIFKKQNPHLTIKEIAKHFGYCLSTIYWKLNKKRFKYGSP